MAKSAVLEAVFDVSTVDYVGNKLYCPDCKQPKSELFFSGKRNTPRCSACISGRPGKKGR